MSMKLKIVKILCLLATLCLSGQVWAQKPVQIKGQLEEAKGISSIKLFKVVNGKPKEIANAIPQGDNKFGFQFFPDYEGLFLIGFGNEGSPGGNFKFYFKGGDKLDFIIRVDPDITYDLVGTENTKENE